MSKKKRREGRAHDALRTVTIEPGYLRHPSGSALISFGDTKVICAASVEDRVPAFLKDSGRGWVTGEYAMIPASSTPRIPREVQRGRPSGRTLEIQRLVGRALRAVIDRKALGERTVTLDCDVIQADGGTRTASITGAFVALCLALDSIDCRAVTNMVAAISVGMVRNTPMLDLDYDEDSNAEVDMNVVRTDDQRYIEVQGTAETTPFDRKQLDSLLTLADGGIDSLLAMQRDVLGKSLTNAMKRR